MIGDQIRAKLARHLLADRQDRYKLFPSEIFDEYAWNMLLHLFVSLAENRVMTEERLILLSGASTMTGQRWLYHLYRDGQVEPRIAGEDVILTPDSLRRLRLYLDHVVRGPPTLNSERGQES